MPAIDRYAADSRLRGESPAGKALFSFGTLLLCLSVHSPLFSAVVLCVMAFACAVGSGTGWLAFLKLCAVPLGFVLIGAVTVAVRLRFVAGNVSVSFQAAQGAALALKSMACVSCAMFLYVSTPVGQLLGLLARLRCPVLLLELMLLVYRFIFVLLEMVHTIRVSQRARLGTNGYAASVRSFSVLAGSVFIKAFVRADRIYAAMQARGYGGGLPYTGVLPRMGGVQRVILALVMSGLTAFAAVCIKMGV